MNFCSRESLAQHEACAGTAVRGEAYVLLPVAKPLWQDNELNGGWAEPAEIQAIRAVRAEGVVTRLYDPADRAEIAPILVHTAPGRSPPAALPAFLARFGRRWPVLDTARPQIAICTHGTRDRCCAKWGFEAWREARRLYEAGQSNFEPLQTSHLGGDRFAATGIVFPSGSMYANLDDEGLAAVLAAEAERRIAPRHYRGGVFEGGLKQIVRAGLADHGLFNDLAAPLRVFRDADDSAIVHAEAGGARFEVSLAEAEISFFGSCAALDRGHSSHARRQIVTQARRL